MVSVMCCGMTQRSHTPIMAFQVGMRVVKARRGVRQEALVPVGVMYTYGIVKALDSREIVIPHHPRPAGKYLVVQEVTRTDAVSSSSTTEGGHTVKRCKIEPGWDRLGPSSEWHTDGVEVYDPKIHDEWVLVGRIY